MQITLNQDEIVQALIAYVKSTGFINDGFDIKVDLKAGRGENGYTATLDVEKKVSTVGTCSPIRPVSHGILRGETQEIGCTPPPEPLVEGEAIVDTKPVVEETEEEVDAVVDAYMESNQAKSLFAK